MCGQQAGAVRWGRVAGRVREGMVGGVRPAGPAKRSAWGILLALVPFLLPSAPARALEGEQPPLSALVQADVRDLSLSLVLGASDPDELGRMGSDFANVYRFGKAKLQFLEPGRMRMESRAGLITVVYAVNQGRKLLAVPGIGVRKVSDAGTSLSARQGLLEVGLVTPALSEAVEATPLGSATVEATPVWRYRLVYTADPHRRRQEIAVDPVTRTLAERIIYREDGSVKVRYVFGEPAEVVEGIWVPRRAEVYSPRGKKAASTRYADVRVNTGLAPETFQF